MKVEPKIHQIWQIHRSEETKQVYKFSFSGFCMFLVLPPKEDCCPLSFMHSAPVVVHAQGSYEAHFVCQQWGVPLSFAHMRLASHERDDVLLNVNSTAFIEVHIICEAQQGHTAHV